MVFLPPSKTPAETGFVKTEAEFDPPGPPRLSLSVISRGQKIDTSFPVEVWHQGQARRVTFGELLTRRSVVSVYMRNNTPSCDRQNESLATEAAALDRAGFNVIAISRDGPKSQARYGAARNLTYMLVSDPDDRFARATDSLIEKSMYGRKFVGPARAAYVLDRDGTVLALTEKVQPAEHAAQLQALIRDL
jgi:peroxiredoxin Q/BCP